jgi:hypothetical protein
MSFYSVLQKRFPGRNQNQIAIALGRNANTIRSWKYVQPTLETLISLADKMGTDEMELISDVVEDLKNERGNGQCQVI